MNALVWMFVVVIVAVIAYCRGYASGYFLGHAEGWMAGSNAITGHTLRIHAAGMRSAHARAELEESYAQARARGEATFDSHGMDKAALKDPERYSPEAMPGLQEHVYSLKPEPERQSLALRLGRAWYARHRVG